MKYKRILLKLSGEALIGEKDFGIDNNILRTYAKQIMEITALGVEVAIVVGGGNIFRGGGVQIAEHNAGAGTITVSSNTFESPFANTFTSSLRLQNNQQDKITIEDIS